VKIELSQDGGVTFPIVILASTVSDGTQAVTVNAAWLTPTARVRVTWVKNAAVSDVSDASFLIQ
jgi:hypothetical protein